MESGVLYSSSMQVINRVTNIKIGAQISRQNTEVLNRGKPLEQRQVINYSPVDVSFDLLKSDNSLEIMLGLINPNGIVTNIYDTNSQTATYGIRSAQVYYAPTTSTNYNGLYDLKSGVITSYGLQGTINEAVRESIGMQFLDMSGSVNTTARDSSNYTAALVNPSNIQLTGIQFTGYGVTGMNVQSFSFNVGFSRVAVMQLGTKFPVRRQLTNVVATMQVQGFIEGLNNSLTGLSQYDCGTPSYGTVGLTMNPLCGLPGTSPSTITMINPYIESFSADAQVGGFTTFSASFSMPIGPNPNETTDGSVVIMT